MKVIEEGWIFDSDFDSGNLSKVELDNSSRPSMRNSSASNPSIAPSAESNLGNNKSTNILNTNLKKKIIHFRLWTKPDGAGFNITKNRTWFHFSIEKESDEQSDVLINLKFSMMNLNSVKKLFEMGMRPVYRSSGSEIWNRIPIAPTVESIEHGMNLHFNVFFSGSSSDLLADEVDLKTLGSKSNPFPFRKVYFAYTVPYTYTYLQKRLNMLENHFAPSYMKRSTVIGKPVSPGSSPTFMSSYNLVNRAGQETNIYFHRDLLTKSLDGHRLDLITISSLDGIIDNPAQEALCPELFPDGLKSRSRIFKMITSGNSISSENLNKAHNEGKKYFFVTARVHPGEAASSFVMDGFLNFILCEHDPRAAMLRSKFVFKIIPMLNPDGCFRGNYRDDSRGVNLNRVYDLPDQNLHPTIYAVKKYITECCNASGEVGLYIDLHAHANKAGCFVFANRMLCSEDRKQIWAFGKKMKEYCVWFDLRECDFSGEVTPTYNSKTSLKAGLANLKISSVDQKKTKDGTGRVAIFAATRCIHSYTFEVNYHGARHDIAWSLAKSQNGDSFVCLPLIKCKVETCLLRKSISSFSAQHSNVERDSGFSIGDFHSMGRSLALAALDVSNT